MKKLSSVMSMNTENTYEKFISEKVLKDPEIIKFIQENNFTRKHIVSNLIIESKQNLYLKKYLHIHFKTYQKVRKKGVLQLK